MRSIKGRQALCQRCNRIWNISRFAVIHGEYMSEMHKEGAVLKEIHIRIERQSTLFDVMEKAGSVIGGLASLGMVYVLGCMVVRFGILI